MHFAPNWRPGPRNQPAVVSDLDQYPSRSWLAKPRNRDKNAKETTYTRTMGFLDGIKSLLTGAKTDAEAVAEGEVPAATPPGSGDERETSTNAQMAGASDEPWPGND